MGDIEVAPSRLRHGAPQELVGREQELGNLDEAWDEAKTHVVTIVAWGGVGKTALVVEWMARLARDDWHGAERVFDWPFHSQGTHEQGAASADPFIAAALEFFGGEEGKQLAASPTSPWDKGARLAQLVGQRRNLLVLDGLEPLQYPPGPMGGRLKDPALEALLKGLAQHNAGLCLVTTRESLADLAPFRSTTAPQWSLGHLSEEAGAQLLFDAGVRSAGNAKISADDKELKDAAREVSGHALTLQLLGRYLAKGHNGDVRKRSLVRFRKADAKVQGGHAFRMLGAYQKWLAEGGEEGKRQLAVLHLLGLFDRPADPRCVTALRNKPAIAGLTDALVGLGDDDWNYTVSTLRECGLISSRESQSEISNPQSTIDCHPLIREYFAMRVRDGSFWSSIFRKWLRRVFPGTSPATPAWRAGHRRLYEYLCATTTDQKPNPTLADLQPLYQAVAHGCSAGTYEEARADVFDRRILRGSDVRGGNYSRKKLGLIGANLAALTCFFEKPWRVLPRQLSESTKAWLFHQTGIHLRAMGLFDDARGALQEAVHMSRGDEKLRILVARCASNLSELELIAGNLADAVEAAKWAVDYADQSGDAYHRMARRTIQAGVWHQAGELEKAMECFKGAEAMQREREPQRPLLYSVHSFRYCDLLLAPAERATWQMLLNPEFETTDPRPLEACHAVQQRAMQVLEESKRDPNIPLLDIALDHLNLGRAALCQTVLANSGIEHAKSELQEAVYDLRHAGTQHRLPLGLLSRALLRFVENGEKGCKADLDEAWETAERGSMRLHMADIHLHRARLFHGVAPYPWDKDEQGRPRGPKDDLAAARKLIEECGYWRRREELEDAEAAAQDW